MGRWIGIDYGSRRIGLAIADTRGRIASPAATLPATDSANRNAQNVLAWAEENEAGGFVVGLPLNMADGSDSDQTKIVRAFAAELAKVARLPVELWDERLSSFQADKFMDAAQVPRSQRKRWRDRLAAQVILQTFLDARLDAHQPE